MKPHKYLAKRELELIILGLCSLVTMPHYNNEETKNLINQLEEYYHE